MKLLRDHRKYKQMNNNHNNYWWNTQLCTHHHNHATNHTTTNRHVLLYYRISFVLNIVLIVWIVLLSLLYHQSDTNVTTTVTSFDWFFTNSRSRSSGSSGSSGSSSSDSSRTSTVKNSLQLQNGETMTFHGGNPISHPITGSCWCNTENQQYCMCNPALAIDLVIVTTVTRTGGSINESMNETETMDDNYYVWLVRRKDTNQLATLGGFVMVGESVEDAVVRELKEETGIDLKQQQQQQQQKQQQQQQQQQQRTQQITTITPFQPVLFGVYSDPRRDNRRHTTSAVYAVHLDGTEVLVAADDVKDVIKIPMKDIEQYTYFADHMTILLDYRKILSLQQRQHQQEQHQQQQQSQSHHQSTERVLHATDFVLSHSDFANNIQRSVCIPLEHHY